MLGILLGTRDSVVRRSVSLLLRSLESSGETNINYLVTHLNVYLQEPLQNSNLLMVNRSCSSSNGLHFEKDVSRKQSHKKLGQLIE